ncbi:MAG: hypothetical protein DMF58_16860 [Acidobacteria bacterium]|nr:MAG: hypothetical protein DMF58_16860 [Acidobacteriota bacterium]
MSELYRKWGRSVRREGSRLVRVDEAGEAMENRTTFRTQPIEDMLELEAPDAEAVQAAAREIESIVKPPLILERLFVSEGSIAHECDGVRWSETLRRVHVAIARPPIRALVDLAEFQFDAVKRIASALLRAGGERDAPKRIRLAENVGAALLSSAKIQKTQSAWPHDGKGQQVIERRVENEEPPNWFRPSYRMRPRRAWFHLRAAPFGRIDDAVPEGIALLAPIGERFISVLCIDGNRVFPTTVPIRRIAAARATETWFPYGAGAFGAELMF